MPYGIPGVPMLPPGGPGVSGVPLELPKNVVRVGEQALWSTTQLAIGAVASTAARVFSTPIGQQGQGFAAALSLAETNLKEGGRIPAGLAYDTFGVACVVQGIAALGPGTADIQTIYKNGVLSWDFLQTVIDIAPCSLVGAGGGVFGSAGTVAAAAEQVNTFNNGNGGLWVYRRHPVALPANTTFNILLRFGANAAPIVAVTDVKIVLVGAYRQAIEIA